MKLIAQVKLQPTEDQRQVLLNTLQVANAACNAISEIAWTTHIFGQYKLQKIVYHSIKIQFSLTAQMVVRCIAKVANAYKLDRKTKHIFRPTGSIAFDDRILRWYIDKSFVSIWTTSGRQKIPFVCGERQQQLLTTRQGESDLVLTNGIFYLMAVCNVEEQEPFIPIGVLGVDMGIVNLAVDSDGEIYSASQVNNVRYRHRRLRTKLQKKNTKSAKRLLKKLSGKEARFARHTNHCLSKHLVAKAQCTKRAIALEDLKGINARIKARRSQRATRMSWSFFQLRQFISYKATRVGVPVFLIDPRNTSRTCPACGYIDKRNRPNQSTFLCVSCGFLGHADTVAASIIARRAIVTWPNAGNFIIDSQVSLHMRD